MLDFHLSILVNFRKFDFAVCQLFSTVHVLRWHIFSFLLSLISADIFVRSRKLKYDAIEGINVLIEDFNTCDELIAEQAVEHIHHKYLSFNQLWIDY